MRQQQQSTAACHEYHCCAAGLDRGLLEWCPAALQMTPLLPSDMEFIVRLCGEPRFDREGNR
jgi:hypothetical protein